MIRVLKIAAVAVALGAFTTMAHATAVIDFGTGDAGVGGSFLLTSGGNATGSAIPVDALTISGAPLNNGVFETTGTAVDAADANGSASLDFNTTSNTITITGGVPGLGIANGTTLLSGTFSSGFTANANGLLNATGTDTKSPLLLAALGLPASTPFDFFGFSLTTNGNGNTTTGVTVISTDFRNTAVPEPATLALFGFGLLGLGAALRRRTRA